ncbi:Protein of unknown function [Gryllus bimaculatus]|nr:Protein of unknown function [Gryllus bimaculatus]
MSTTGSDHPRVAANDADGTHKTYVTLDVFSQLMPWINRAASGESRHWKAGSRHVMQERAKLYKNDISPRSCDATWSLMEHQCSVLYTRSQIYWKILFQLRITYLFGSEVYI